MIALLILQVALPVPMRRLFDYLPLAGVDPARWVPGVRVKVPFGARTLVGVLSGTAQKTQIHSQKLKRVIALLDETPLFDETLLHVCRFASEYYHYPLGEVFDCALPQALRQGKPALLQQQRYWCLSVSTSSESPRSSKQRQALQFLKEHPEGVTELALIDAGFSRAFMQSLEKKEWAMLFTKDQKIDPVHVFADTAPTLVGDQEAAVKKITTAKNFKVFLLDGVTGSGKTEVYLQAIAAILMQQKQVLVLVPEIGLTPQTIERFQARFQVNVVALHSGLNDHERLQAWLMAKSGNAKIIIGTRSAIFIPLKNPGMIVIDEEHDGSFKQQDGVRYHARDLAIVRAQFEKIPIVLGSATPSLETYYNCQQNRFERLVLTQRAGNAKPPRWTLLDLRAQTSVDGLSPRLIEKIKEHLQKDSEAQVLLFLNRRGYAPTLMCYQCGWMALCDHCNVRMTVHQIPAELHCHHCDRAKRIPEPCPKCRQRGVLHPVGVGTERVEEALQKEFSKFGVVRIDRDSTRKKGAIEQLLKDVHHGKQRILLGTQMIAKGHHFPNVTLVAVLDVDSGFFSTDFRAVERTGQLLLQVAGRAGRADKLGEVVVQTLQPDYPLFQQIITQTYFEVAQSLLQERLQLDLPPMHHAVLFRAEALVQKIPLEFLQSIQALGLEKKLPSVHVMTPIFAPMPKRAGRYRAQWLLLSSDRKALHQLLTFLCEAIELMPAARQVRWSIDVDPMEMM